ncbi:DUF2935 domain-containing protein [Clostridium cellulovorans]|uniref:DUF2935 domain-containing protein n=1 Tax=Clostridium cellulovorans (strain ATCC 35296 / DSM 3052 / OCM 3 / 743B) TaxID=573061 RepID=D9SW82_CLOC7|nr:DUF2935 domain-containing protein [Clostridium cellulovorans]ADL51226.1 Protein of unknown function DUF2935 [Clostridium cellulovorans 743B]
MLGKEDFIRQSLELNLFFMRIMKEHSFFLEAGFTPRDADLAKEGDNFKDIFTKLLAEAISLSNGIISPMVKNSGELFTKYTVSAERASEFYTGIKLNTNITKEEEEIDARCDYRVSRELEAAVRNLNTRAMKAVRALINYKTEILDGMLSCKLFTVNYPLLIDHVRREAMLYYNMLYRLQKGIEIDMAREAVEQQRFWNRIMAEHAKFIRGFLDPTEETLIMTANNFAKEFDQLTAESIKLNDCISDVVEEDLQATKKIRNFKSQATEGLLDCKIRSIILPLLGDHTLREANHYLRLLKIFSKRV